ncbi:MAG: hypothetical protein KKA67_04935, partial [Spirochaetes bacterium]|nr:hypothetical protein [Spirochaetota bacterium]
MAEGTIERTYYSYRARAADEHHIDDITCADLSLDSVFERVDRSSSSPGGSVLYAWARTQPAGRDALSARL